MTMVSGVMECNMIVDTKNRDVECRGVVRLDYGLWQLSLSIK